MWAQPTLPLRCAASSREACSSWCADLELALQGQYLVMETSDAQSEVLLAGRGLLVLELRNQSRMQFLGYLPSNLP